MGEYMIVNPRRRKKARKAKRSKARKSSRRRRPVSARGSRVRLYVNPSKRKSSRRRRSGGLGGFKIGNFAGLNLQSAFAGAIGVVAAEQLTVMATTFVPAGPFREPLGRIALKLGVAAFAVTLTKRFLGGKLAADLATGMGISVALDAYKMVSAGVPGLPQLGEIGEIVPSIGELAENDYAADEDLSGLGALTQPAFSASW
jgi:hypothetical protein